VREALIALEVSGKVSIRVGHGVQILEATPRSGPPFSREEESNADIGPIQLMEARGHVELKTTELAAMNRDRTNLEKMKLAIEVQARAKAVNASEYRNGDRDFHVEIAKASGNAAYALIGAGVVVDRYIAVDCAATTDRRFGDAYPAPRRRSRHA
jgi:DNA-binding FadR family transcriptional regulator